MRKCRERGVLVKYVYIDSGTTNSRLYLVEDGKVVSVKVKEVGTVDNVTGSDSRKLEKCLKEAYDEMTGEEGLTDRDIDGIFMSGMATSKNGICEVDFLPVPLSIRQYADGIHMYETPCFGREVGFLTGIVDCPKEKGNLDNVEDFHNVRGEEIELFGIMEEREDLFRGKRTAVIMPGSHTHILYAEDCRITGITSCMGGEMYKAMAGDTILKASVSLRPQQLCTEAIAKGYRMTVEKGVNRALYITRTLDLFTRESRIVRDSYLEGVVNAGIVTALKERPDAGELDVAVIAGDRVYHEIFGTLIKSAGLTVPVAGIEAEQERSFALNGFLHVMKNGSLWEEGILKLPVQ